MREEGQRCDCKVALPFSGHVRNNLRKSYLSQPLDGVNINIYERVLSFRIRWRLSLPQKFWVVLECLGYV